MFLIHERLTDLRHGITQKCHLHIKNWKLDGGTKQ